LHVSSGSWTNATGVAGERLKVAQKVRFEKWNAAALCLASGGSLADAAAAGGVSVRQLFRWRQRPAFIAALNRHRDDMAAEAVGRLSAALGKAVDTLAGLLDDPLPFVKLRAASEILAACVKLRESVDQSARIGELESRFTPQREVV
jgi:hypothetical protein